MKLPTIGSRNLCRQMIVRYFAAPKGKGAQSAVVEEVVDLTKFVPVNILKDGTHPEKKPMEEYPEWLPTLLDEQATFGELERKGFDNLSFQEQKRYLSLGNRKIVKKNNDSRSKK